MLIPELEELRQIRLDGDLTYQQLSRLIGAANGGEPMSERTIYRLLNTDDPAVWERTLHKIRKYLATRKRDAGIEGARRKRVAAR